jgi:hypothetical protein
MKLLRSLADSLLLPICLAVIGAKVEGAVVSKEELAAAVKWFDGIEWPDVKEKPYVEIRFGHGMVGSKRVEGPKVRGFLLGEDEKEWRLFVVGHAPADGIKFGRNDWPFCVQKFLKSKPEANEDSKAVMTPLDLASAVDQMLAALRVPVDQEDRWRRDSGQASSDRAILFMLARMCARRGSAELAEKLDDAIMTLPGLENSRRQEAASFREGTEKEIGHVLMWKAVVDFGDFSIPRPQLLEEFERIVRDFPASEHRERAKGYVEILRTMVAEDAAHPAVDLEKLAPAERVKELIFRLRDQNGHQYSQPGACDIFGDWGGAAKRTSPAHQLVELGHAAVPQLIGALEDKRPSRSVGYHRDFYFSHFVLTVGDCAEAILARISGRNFWKARTTSAAMQKDGATTATRAAIEAWWREVKDKGEKAILIEGVHSGKQDGVEQARRLIAMDSAAALEAIAKGIQNANSHWTQTELVRQLARIDTPDATAELRRQMKSCASLNGRVSSAWELLERGDKETVSAMIEEWGKWRDKPGSDSPLEDGNPAALVDFLEYCRDVRAMNALAERAGNVPIHVQFVILKAIIGSQTWFRPKKKDAAPIPPELDAVAEKLAAKLLDDRVPQYGMRGSWHGFSYVDPRVCDFAAVALARRWPDRYQFAWTTTRIERDEQIAKIRNTWRKSQGLEEVPPIARPPAPAAEADSNTISALRWKGGPPMKIGVLEEGKPLTATGLAAALMKLHSEIPKENSGFLLTAERAAGARGFLVEVEWEKGRRPANPKGWNIKYTIELGGESTGNSSGWSSLEHPSTAESYKDRVRSMERALDGPISEGVSMTFLSRLSGGE